LAKNAPTPVSEYWLLTTIQRIDIKELMRMDNVPSAANDGETRWSHGAGCWPARADLDGLRHGAASRLELWKERGIRASGSGACWGIYLPRLNSLRGITAREERISID